MPEPKLKKANNVKSEKSTPTVLSEAVQANLLQIFGDGGSTYKPTEAQVDRILALQEKGMDYTHDERTSVSPRQKWISFTF